MCSGSGYKLEIGGALVSKLDGDGVPVSLFDRSRLGEEVIMGAWRHRHCVMCGLDVVDGEERVLLRRVAAGAVPFGMEIAICVECWGKDMSRQIVVGATRILRGVV